MKIFNIIEIFTSIQGEGTRIGRKSTFVRLSGCNLSCTWCDTTYSWKPGDIVLPEKINAKEISARIKANDVVITGGEPLLNDISELLETIQGKFITVETNATRFRPDERINLWSLSPKIGSSGQSPQLGVIDAYLKQFPERVQLKFVVQGKDDVASVKDLLSQLRHLKLRSVPIVIQPVGLSSDTRKTYCDKMRILIEEYILEDEFWNGYELSILPQLHRLIWGQLRGI